AYDGADRHNQFGYFAIGRLTPGGDFDPTFDADGIAVEDRCDERQPERVTGLAVQADGRVLMVGDGQLDPDGRQAFALARFKPNAGNQLNGGCIAGPCNSGATEPCGNGGPPEDGEECDDGNSTPCDGCTNCRLDVCGDDRVCPAIGEQCDDGRPPEDGD